MHPKTFYGWYNVLVRGYNYNEETAYLLDHTFRPNHRLLSVVEKQGKKPKERKSIRERRIG